MASIDELWQQVVESPDDLAARLVLADALIEQGDSRGELFALQCRGADSTVLVGGDDTPSDENVAERVSELIASNWTHWLGNGLAALLVRQGSTFVDGMLSLIQVGAESTPPQAWSTFGGHRELCAVQRVRPFKVRADHYATFLAALTRDPPYVEIHAPLVMRNLREKRKQWAVRTLRFGGIQWWSQASSEPGLLASEFQALAEIATELEAIEIPPTWSIGAELADLMSRLPRMFEKLQRVKLEDCHLGWVGESEARLRAMPHVEMT